MRKQSMKKVVIVFLFLTAMSPLYGTRSKKPHRVSLSQAAISAERLRKVYRDRYTKEQQWKKAQEISEDAAHKKLVDSRIKEHSESELKEFCIKVIACGCMYAYLEHGHQIASCFNTTKLH